MFSDLQNALKRPPDGILRLDGSTLSDSIGSLFADFLPGGRFEAKVEEPKNVTFNDGRVEVAALKVEGTLLGEFLGVAGLKVQAWFFLTSGDRAEVAMIVDELPDLSRSFPGFREAAAFSKCAFALDSRRLNPLGADFDHLFSAAKDARKGPESRRRDFGRLERRQESGRLRRLRATHSTLAGRWNSRAAHRACG